jgi:hypothetical protein
MSKFASSGAGKRAGLGLTLTQTNPKTEIAFSTLSIGGF